MDVSTPVILGLDAGSVSVKLAALSADGRLLDTVYQRHKGQPLHVAALLLSEWAARFPGARLACTGTAGAFIAKKLEAPAVNELAALALALQTLHPDVQTIIEMGGEDAKCIFLRDGQVHDFALNSVCAAGTGSFLDQQAERLQLTIESFSTMAQSYLEKGGVPARIAGRCSVFAKSDMIHLQQIATPVEAIVSGLCYAVARNYLGAIIRNRTVLPRVAFLGGVALNAGVVAAMRDVLAQPDLFVPDPPTIYGAAGVALKALQEKTAVPLDVAALANLAAAEVFTGSGRSPLVVEGDSFSQRHLAGGRHELAAVDETATGELEAYLGIDIGSISTCLALVDDAGRVLTTRYLRTAGRPIEAVRQGLREIGQELAVRKGPKVVITGVGTTGSGRYMIADYIAADVVKNEITAQAMGAVHLDPTVDTIFEIGGQDSKYIQLKDGVIVDFEMNKACAAGTGSFLEEQAEKLDVCVKTEFSPMALGAGSPCRLGERCTVFMENSLQASLQQGAGKDDLLAGLSYSIVENYINRVVQGRPVGRNIFFQGGTAFNKGVVAAFEKFLGRQVTVPPHHDNTGAIGMALIAREHHQTTGAASTFKGFEVADRGYTQTSFACKACDNHCEINRLKIDGEEGYLFYGGRCEKYDIRKATQSTLPDLFGFREQALEAAHQAYMDRHEAVGRPAKRGRMGLPRVFFFHDFLPYYATLLWELGFEPVLSPRTNRQVIALGVQATMADTCFPIKAALGHVRHLLNNGVDQLFIPSFTNMAEENGPFQYGHACPLTQSFPYQVRQALAESMDPAQGGQGGARILAPVQAQRFGRKQLFQGLKEALAAPYRIRDEELRQAMDAAEHAQRTFRERIQTRGRQAIAEAEASPDRTLVVVGRPYNAFDMGLNLEIPKKLATLNVQAIPMDFLPPEEIHAEWPEMYWRSGQRMLSAVRYIRKHPKLHPPIIGNFSCGPDSFIEPYMERELGGKPSLHIEIDEHSADAGVITRCEAFLDSLEMQERAQTTRRITPPAPVTRSHAGLAEGVRRTVFIPHMCNHAYALEAAFASCGVKSEVLPETTPESLAIGRKYVSGKECYPFCVTLGDMIHRGMQKDFDPSNSAFLMWGGTGPCRFGQYNVLQRMLLAKAGLGDVPMVSPVQDANLYKTLGVIGKGFAKRSWEGLVAVDILLKFLYATRPYEKVPGSTNQLYDDAFARLKKLIATPGKVDFLPLLEQFRNEFEEIRDKNAPLKPRVGVVGEIYVRSNRFANEELIGRIEAMGGEVWTAPIDEWVKYINWGARMDARMAKDWSRFLTLSLKHWFQDRIAHKQESVVAPFHPTMQEPHVNEVLNNAMQYLHPTFRGEAVLSVGKSVDMLNRGAVGIVNAMPFGCMPGSIVSSMLRTLSERFNAPAVAMPFDGTASPTLRLQLETFMEQAHARFERLQRGAKA
ncbi:MAG: acyl-CoA dehydratase activase [Desulfovibrio sp.]|nr:acyl-CoA dehydratase activase [Desulfovibrio sp.]